MGSVEKVTRQTRVMVTGANGMLGRHLVPKLYDLNYDVYPVYSEVYDLRYKSQLALSWCKPHIIFHLAAHVGGLQHNLSDSANIFHDNVMMNTDLIFHAARGKVKKFILAGSVCSYPANAAIPTDESWFGLGYPEQHNEAYGMSKIAALIQLRSCYDQYDMDFSYPVLANMYGPYDRGFQDSSRSHVIPSLIRQFMNENEVIVWGDGRQTRDLLYVEDAANALAKMIDVDYRCPVNVATGKEISIKQICDMLRIITNFDGETYFVTSKPTGQSRRCYSVKKAEYHLDWKATTGIEEGLRKTVEWYANHRDD